MARSGVVAAPKRILVYWWHRFGGETRFGRRDETFTCAGGLECTCTANTSRFGAADGVVIWVGARPQRRCLPPKLRHQRWLLEFYEPAAYYPELADPTFLRLFELEMSWRLSSSIVVSLALSRLVLGGPFRPAQWLNMAEPRATGMLPKVSAIAWAAGHCDAPSGRASLVLALRAALGSSLPIHAMGACMHDFEQDPMQPRGAEGERNPKYGRELYWRKVRAYSRHRFCLVAENAVEADYVTEALFHAFAAGCLPIYYGAPNVALVLPTPTAIVNVEDFDTVAQLSAHLLALAANEDVLRRRLAWRGDASLVSDWWRRLRRLMDPLDLRSRRQQLCAVCERMHETAAPSAPSPRRGLSRAGPAPTSPHSASVRDAAASAAGRHVRWRGIL
jgi:hypothetical protein